MPSDSALSALEARLRDLQAALTAPTPDKIQDHAQAVRDCITTLAQWLARTPPESLPPDTRRRAQALATQLSGTRDQLARVLALTQQQAASLLPPVDPVTYGPTGTSRTRI